MGDAEFWHGAAANLYNLLPRTERRVCTIITAHTQMDLRKGVPGMVFQIQLKIARMGPRIGSYGTVSNAYRASFGLLYLGKSGNDTITTGKLHGKNSPAFREKQEASPAPTINGRTGDGMILIPL